MGDANRQAHIVIMDNAPAVLGALQELFVDGGYRDSISRSPLHKRQLMKLAPDVIVHDVMVDEQPDLGLEYLTLLRRDPDVANIPMILLTAARESVQDPDVAAGLERLGVHILLKPASGEALLATAEEALAA